VKNIIKLFMKIVMNMYITFGSRVIFTIFIVLYYYYQGLYLLLKIILRYFILLFSWFFPALRFEFRSWHLLGRCSYCLSHSASPFYFLILVEMGLLY
jgi:hypothetical protein